MRRQEHDGSVELACGCHEGRSLLAVAASEILWPSARQVLRLWRRHRTIENGLHWIRDVVFGEDAYTTHTAGAPLALAVFRNLALSLLHRWRGQDITAARQFYANHPAALIRRLALTPRRL